MARSTRSPRLPRLRPRKEEAEESNAIIDEIYRNDGNIKDDPPLTTIERSKERRFPKRLLITLAVLAVLVAATLAGFYTFNRDSHFNEQSVNLGISSPSSVTSAAPATYVFTISNEEAVGITNVELSVETPDGWAFSVSDPAASDANNTLWGLGQIPAHGSRTVSVTGAITGEVGSVVTFNASVTYRPTNFNYDFTARASGSVSIASSIVTLDLKGPSQASPGSTIRYVLTYTNTSSDTLNDLRLVATYPDGFTIKTTDPNPRDGNNLWAVNELKSGEKGTITIDGSFKGNVGDAQQLTFDAELKQGTAFERQVETTAVVQLIASTLTLQTTVNTSLGPVVAANPGDQLSFDIAYTNASDLEITDATVSVTFAGGAFDAVTFADDYGTVLKDGKASWDVKKVPDLASIDPGMSGTVRFTLKVPAAPSAAKNETGPQLTAKATIAASGGDSAIKADAETLTVRINSKPTLNVSARYYDAQGATLGSGPLPPTVGQTTAYRVFWTVTNTTNDLNVMTVAATVPSTVFWSGKNITASAGSVTFDTAQRQVVWTLNRLPAGVGQSGSPVTASFELSVTPGPSDIGAATQLLGPTSFSATDSFTGATVSASSDLVTTDLTNDTKAAGQGIVVGQ